MVRNNNVEREEFLDEDENVIFFLMAVLSGSHRCLCDQQSADSVTFLGTLVRGWSTQENYLLFGPWASYIFKAALRV